MDAAPWDDWCCHALVCKHLLSMWSKPTWLTDKHVLVMEITSVTTFDSLPGTTWLLLKWLTSSTGIFLITHSLYTEQINREWRVSKRVNNVKLISAFYVITIYMTVGYFHSELCEKVFHARRLLFTTMCLRAEQVVLLIHSHCFVLRYLTGVQISQVNHPSPTNAM